MNLSQDYLYIDDLETIDYGVKEGEGGYTSQTVANVYREPVEHAFIPNMLAKDNCYFHLWTVPLAGITPKLNDTIEDSQDFVWTVKTVEECDRDATGVQRYRCGCVKGVQ